MRVLKVLLATHLLAFLLPILLFVIAFGPLVAAPAVEVGPFIGTCIADKQMDGSTVYGCFGAWK